MEHPIGQLLRRRPIRNDYSVEEVAAHNSRDDALIIVNNKVYDISLFLSREFHPGGEVIWTHAGKDATDVMGAYHPPYVFKKKLAKYFIGTIKDPPTVEPMIKEYREMHENMKAAGLYEFKAWFVVVKCFYPLLMIAFALWVFQHQSDSLLVNVFAGGIVGLAQHQWAFIGHDACHASYIGLTLENNSFWGNQLDQLLSTIFATAGFGCSSIWWKYTHNQHHVVVNEFDRDPDVTHLPFYAVTRRMFLSNAKGKKMTAREMRMCRMLVGMQQFTFFPVMLVIARASLVLNALWMQWVSRRVPTMPWQPVHYNALWVWLDRLAVVAHIIWVAVLFMYAPPAGYRIYAFAASWLVVSFLHVQLVLSHWERPMKHSTEEMDNWFVKQTLTGCNIEPYWWNEWFLGGLHFQIEHHLYPRMPRYSLRKVRYIFVQP